jgi:hypothetical protein
MGRIIYAFWKAAPEPVFWVGVSVDVGGDAGYEYTGYVGGGGSPVFLSIREIRGAANAFLKSKADKYQSNNWHPIALEPFAYVVVHESRWSIENYIWSHSKDSAFDAVRQEALDFVPK